MAAQKYQSELRPTPGKPTRFQCGQAHCRPAALSQVFRRLGFVLRHPECEAVATCAPGAVERVLKLLRVRLAEYETEHPGGPPPSRCACVHNTLWRLLDLPLWHAVWTLGNGMMQLRMRLAVCERGCVRKGLFCRGASPKTSRRQKQEVTNQQTQARQPGARRLGADFGGGRGGRRRRGGLGGRTGGRGAAVGGAGGAAAHRAAGRHHRRPARRQ